MSADLHARVDNAIARVTASKAAAEVLAEIGTTHVLIPRKLVERAAKAKRESHFPGGSFDMAVVATDLARYWKGETE